MTSESAAPAEMPGVEEIAQVLHRRFGIWYEGPCSETDSQRQCREDARAVMTLFAPILAEKEREIASLRLRIDEQSAALESVCVRLVAAKSALTLVAEQDVTEIALDPDWPRRICAAAIRAQGE